MLLFRGRGLGFEAFAGFYVNDDACFEDLTGFEERQAGSGEAGGNERVRLAVLEGGLYRQRGAVAAHACGHDDCRRQAVEVNAFALQGWVGGYAFDQAGDLAREGGNDSSHHASISCGGAGA